MADQTTTRNAEWHLWSAQQRERILKRPLEDRLQIVRRPSFANLTEQDQKAVWTSIRIPPQKSAKPPARKPQASRKPQVIAPALKRASPRRAWSKAEFGNAVFIAFVRWGVLFTIGLMIVKLLQTLLYPS